jgi:hypothetical protein
MKNLYIFGIVIGSGYVLMNVAQLDFMSPACRAEAEALQQRSEQIEHDLLIIQDSYTVLGRARSGAPDEVKLRQDRFLVDLDAFDRRCK